MTTTYYLADVRYMDQDEIARAERFDDQARLCLRNGGFDAEHRVIFVYRLLVPIELFDLIPSDVRIIADSSAPEETVGHLKQSIDKGKLITLDEVLKEELKGETKWLRTRPKTREWDYFAAEFAVKSRQTGLIFALPSATEYLKRTFGGFE